MTVKKRIYSSFLLEGEGGPYVCYDFDFNSLSSRLGIRYSRLGGAALRDWNIYMELTANGTSMRGFMFSRVRGKLEEVELKMTKEIGLVVRPTVVGSWHGDCIATNGSKWPIVLSLEAGQRSIENPTDHDLAFTPSKIGSLEVSGWHFPLPSVTIDYLSGRIHCVHKVTDNGARLQFAGEFGDQGVLTGKLELAEKGVIGECVLQKAELV